MSRTTSFPPGQHPVNAITERVLGDDSTIAYTVDGDALVMAVKGQVLVRASAVGQLGSALTDIAEPVGSLSGRGRGERGGVGDDGAGEGAGGGGGAEGQRPAGGFSAPGQAPALVDDTEIWRLSDPGRDVFETVDGLNRLVDPMIVATHGGTVVHVPAASPNHVCTVSSYDSCPAGPPSSAAPPAHADTFIDPTADPPVDVVVIDTGFIRPTPPHTNAAYAALDGRVTPEAGWWFDSGTQTWQLCPPDSLHTTDPDVLDGVAGHGTFIAGIVAHRCREARITVVGERRAVMSIGPHPAPTAEAALYADELSVARMLLESGGAAVVSCGFSFPTLDGHPSVPFTSVMQAFEAADLDLAVVAPAGNESSDRAYWPAAHPRVIGVAATNRRENRRAWFSNWGPWVNCATRGEAVRSTFIYWDGKVEGVPSYESEDFDGWARWDGTSFAAPKVAAAIASLVAQRGVTPGVAYGQLVGGTGGHPVTTLVDTALTPVPVPLPNLHLG